MILAKPVIPNQYWILRQDDRKVGNIEAGPDGFSLKINNETTRFKSIQTLKQKVNITFENTPRAINMPVTNSVHGYPTSGLAHNAIFDVKHQLPLWTMEPRSKSWYTAGWYLVKQHRNWKLEYCPKLILLQRYQYQGPFHSREQAEAQQ
jgi:hypothetical protein